MAWTNVHVKLSLFEGKIHVQVGGHGEVFERERLRELVDPQNMAFTYLLFQIAHFVRENDIDMTNLPAAKAAIEAAWFKWPEGVV
jgi:hypothetical protein